ncbi:MAG: Asp-tRNA(Asn)/Glu-tRNA(Gln) amidotransferase subunit GatC [Puniceicoccales bacterium]|jgi:aspartyl-tRNA(Asn)/glutamyl-tRNA(Gln) amidotransferase subunit C|nr:Asp-tRNA(Asn)/Glu-tRNA(Gln) amidotransferase subunit GatC [Puniceicoccales bacterium]
MNPPNLTYLAKLAHLKLTEEEEATFSQQMASIVEYCSRIGSVDVSQIPPTSHLFEEGKENEWQEDEPTEAQPIDRALRNAPDVRENQITVPRVIQ